MFKCQLLDKTSIPYKQIDEFIAAHAINQQSYRMAAVYSSKNDFHFNYIVCEHFDKICGAMPFVLFEHELGNVIHSMPFLGYGGIASIPELKESVFSHILNFLIDTAKAANVLLATICMPPFQQEYNLYKYHFNPDFEKKNFYQYIDLSEDVLSKCNSKFRGNIKRNIRKCENYGVTLFESSLESDLKEWYNNIYLKRLTETGCAIYPYSLFETFISNIGNGRIKVVYAKMNDNIIGGGFFLNQGISFDNFMRVIGSDYFYTQAGNLIDYWSIDLARSLKIRYYNWQSCDGIGSTIFRYKEDWGSKLDHHYYLTKITGDITLFKKVPLEIIKNEYKGLYVMPYEEFTK